MDWQAMMDEGGTDLAGGFLGSFFQARAANKVRKAQNRNAAITGARNEGILSQHRAQIREEAMTTRMQIQRARNKAQAAQKTAAAHAGVQGGSVDAANFDIARSAAERLHTLQTRAERELADNAEKSYQNKVNIAMGQQSMLSGPSLVGLALGMAGIAAGVEADTTGSDGITPNNTPGTNKGTGFKIL